MRTLNRQRPYGEVHGCSVLHKFEQDGLKFGPDGMEIVEEEEQEVIAPAPVEIAKIQESAGPPQPPGVVFAIKHKGGGKYIVISPDGTTFDNKFSRDEAQAEADRLNSEGVVQTESEVAE